MSDPDTADTELMARFARGDAAAFEALYRRHELKVFRYLLRHVRDHAVANDLMQEVWFAVARGAARYQPSARFTTWLYTLAHNRMVDALRARREHLSLEGSGEEEDDPTRLVERIADAASAEPQAVVENREVGERLLAAVEALPLGQREAFVLQAEGDLSVEEIARYARTKLRQLLQEYA